MSDCAGFFLHGYERSSERNLCFLRDGKRLSGLLYPRCDAQFLQRVLRGGLPQLHHAERLAGLGLEALQTVVYLLRHAVVIPAMASVTLRDAERAFVS